MVNLHALGVAEAGVVHEQAAAKDGLQAGGKLGSERYLRHEVKHLLTALQLLLDKVDIHLCLARRGNAMKENRGPSPSQDPLCLPLKGGGKFPPFKGGAGRV